MSSSPDVKQVLYRHLVLEGTPYQAGQQWAQVLKDDPGLVAFMTSPFMGRPPLQRAEVERAITFYERWCPGANQEIQGFADDLGVPPEHIIYYFAYIHPAGQACSQMVVTPPITAGGRIYLGRSYDFSWDDRPFLVTTRLAGSFAHLGFALQLFGRAEGMNEQGLCISSSAGVIMALTPEEGAKFVAVIRGVLDRCRDVDEALDLIQSMPISDCRNFLLADRSGRAALVEVASAHKTVRRAGGRGEPGFLVSANHFALPEMAAFDTRRVAHSTVRYQAMQSQLEQDQSKITPDRVKHILSTPYPQGVCCHYYSQGMGTMWSLVFDPQGAAAEVCFGSPFANPWRSIGLNDPPGLTNFQAHLPDEPIPGGFFARAA